jgi:hypothetical protein
MPMSHRTRDEALWLAASHVVVGWHHSVGRAHSDNRATKHSTPHCYGLTLWVHSATNSEDVRYL